ncbi:MAG: phenylacetate--CoA ligase [Desulfobacteraceae bacterium 4572_35.2]|nr:MAG: phenylacetate--CoA ligase [Desulfobacteraceae bacterium 4572_35.2]
MTLSPYYEPELETLSQRQLKALQSERLQHIVRYVYDNNAQYRQRFDSAGMEPNDIHGIDDLGLLPLMSKEQLRDNYPLGLSCVDKKTLVEMHMSSGSTGVPVVMPYTRGDLEQWASCMSRCYRMAGVEPSDVIQITPSFGLFNGGFGFYHGAQNLDLFVVPTGAGHTRRQISLARDFKTHALTGVVSYATRILEQLEATGETLPDLKVCMFGAEIFSNSMKEKVCSGLGVEAFDIYGMTETGGVGTLGMDCSAHDGLHVWEDHYLIEILDPKTQQPVADGEMGELVVTALTREALPVIRFRTADLTRIVSRQPCQCGRTHVRIAPITGRLDDMLIVKGVNFFPVQVEQALMSIPGVRPHYQIIIEDDHGVKDVRVNVEVDEGVTGFMVERVLKEALGFSPKGDVFKPGELPRQEGKAQRVFYSQK